MKFPSAPLPSTNPTASYWLSQVDQELKNIGQNERLPPHVNTVIVGSGITGALIAHELNRKCLHVKSGGILMLEARDLCSGASGRNGGHIKPDCYKSYNRWAEKYGAETAAQLCRFEVENRNELARFIKEENLSPVVELIETHAVDFFMNQQSWADACESLDARSAAIGETDGIRRHEKSEAQAKFRFQGVCGAVSYPACTLWPFKLAEAILRGAVAEGLKILTHTPVKDISPGSEPGQWLVHTPRGTVRCSRVFHATNGYISNLLPEFAGKVVPVKGNIVALEPIGEFADAPLDHSAGVQWGVDFDYMIQRQSDGKPLIYGGQDLEHPDGLAGVIGDADDSKTTGEILNALQRFPSENMPGWSCGRLRNAWSGIMGFTADEHPFVGKLPGRPGQFVAAGFNGHGMARIFLAVKGLVQYALDEPVDPRVPRLYFDIENRMAHHDSDWENFLSEALVKRQRSRTGIKQPRL